MSYALVPRRYALLGAMLAFALGLAFALSSAMTVRVEAMEPGLESDVQSVVAGSRITIQIAGSNEQVNWTGKVTYPDASEHSWQSLGLVAGHLRADLTNLEEGDYVIDTTGLVPAGYDILGFQAFNQSPFGTAYCGASWGAWAGPAVVKVTAAKPMWNVCLRVQRSNAIPDASLEITAVNAPWVPTFDAEVMEPSGATWTWYETGLESAAHSGQVLFVGPGTHYILPGAPATPGYDIAGYHAMDASNPQQYCPLDFGLYGPNNGVTISAAQPKMRICVLFKKVEYLPGSHLSLGIHAIGNGGNDNPWQGYVDGPQGYDFTFAEYGIGGPNYLGARTNLGAGNYEVPAANPIRPGWSVKGYAVFESDNLFPQCPNSFASYGASLGEVTLSEWSPRWAVCAWVEKAPAVARADATPNPGKGNPQPGWPFPVLDIPTTGPVTGPGSTPAATSTPASTSTPTSQPAGQGQEPPPTAAAATPVHQPIENPAGGAPAGKTTPIAPSTGTTGPTAGAASNGMAIALGALLVAVSGLFLTAPWLPGRAGR